ncbi:VRR-NUC domain-containing protein [Stutzerimonas stutzeri]|jgi:hypothetical protein|uniref:VRR-NUC domain-containing protein n=1 Tax=Stutzerimonas stutzeri TaxID=316 RepID=UPI0005EB156A|nr:VRR-NUC domain-containing protein [Stutzerimonas stutzeri]
MLQNVVRRRPVDFEGREQQMLVRWMELQHRAAYAVTWHTPNGGARDKATAGKLKAQGVKAGVPDLQLAVARGGFFGLFIEFKATPPNDAAVSETQKAMLSRLQEQGYRAVVCRGINEAMAEINAYLAMPRTVGGRCA